MATPQPTAMNQHYVPRAYLAQFAQGEQVWTYDKQLGKSFHANLKNVATERNFYDSDRIAKLTGNVRFIEEAMQRIEARYGVEIEDVIALFNRGKRLRQPSARQFFSFFFALQYIRTKEMQVRARHLVAEGARIAINGHIQHGTPIPADIPKTPEEVDAVARELHHRQLVDVKFIAELSAAFMNHIWVAIKAAPGMVFLTSDHPLCLVPNIHGVMRNNGPLSRGIEVHFPLSDQILLALYERTHFHQFVGRDGTSMDTDEDGMRYFNQYPVQTASRFLFSKTADFLLAEEILRRNPKLKDPDRQRVRIGPPGAL